MTDPKNPSDPRSKKISQAPPPIPYLTGGGVSPPPGRPPLTPKGMVGILDFIEQNEDARKQLDDGDVTAVRRSRDGRLWDIRKSDWGDNRVWARVRRTGHVRDGVVGESPVFIKKEVEQPDTTITGGVEDRNDERPEDTPLYLAFMAKATREMGLKLGIRTPKKTIEGWLRDNWPPQLGEPSNRKIKNMATLLRHPKDERGGHFSPERDK